MRLAEYNKIIKIRPVKRSKYGNIITEYKGRKYHSKKEAQYARDLDLLKNAQGNDRVLSWIPQVRYDLEIDGIHICTYVLDFLVEYTDGRIEYVDVKSKATETDLYKIKKKLMYIVHGIEIVEK